MKKMTCKEMGGACDFVITGETAKELMDNGKKHVHDASDDAHNATIEKMKAMSKEDHDRWAQDFTAKFDSLQDA